MSDWRPIEFLSRPMPETIPQMRQRHAREIRQYVEGLASLSITQTEAARTAGVSLTCLNNIIQRNGIHWPVKMQGRRPRKAT